MHEHAHHFISIYINRHANILGVLVLKQKFYRLDADLVAQPPVSNQQVIMQSTYNESAKLVAY